MEFNIAFSSSGVRFAAHVGVLAYLQDNDIRVRNYSGTSGGAIVAAWGANNLPARELMDLTLKFGYFKYFVKPGMHLGGIFDNSNFGNIVSSYCKPKENLWIITFNILKMQKEIWNGKNINLSKIITATTCVPGLFKPVIYRNGLHVDGLFARFCPDDLWDSGVTLSVQLKCKVKKRSRYPLDNFVYCLEQATLDFLEETQKKNLRTDNILYIQPDVSSIAQTDFFAINTEDHLELFKKGYEGAKQVIENELVCYVKEKTLPVQGLG